MRIAIPYYEGLIFQHFGHAKQFKIYEIENHQVLMEAIVGPEDDATGHDAVAEFLKSPFDTVLKRRLGIATEGFRDRELDVDPPLGVPGGPAEWELQGAALDGAPVDIR